MDETAPAAPATPVERVAVELEIGGRRFEIGLDVPRRPMRLEELLPFVYQLAELVTRAAIESSEAAKKPLSCRAGCGACCRQLVPISPAEARRLGEVVARLEEPFRQRVQERFHAALEELRRRGILPRLLELTRFPSVEDGLRFGLEYFRLGIPCPFLEEESCGIYPDRPLACREYLVTSPAANCAAPSADTIDLVPLSLQLSRLLWRFEDGRGWDSPRCLALIASPLLAQAEGGRRSALVDGPLLVQNLLLAVQERLSAPGR